ncbi:MAG TPA: Si-specific NAD(P)(+) transhydrogenase [Polyangiaceae bacterium]
MDTNEFDLIVIGSGPAGEKGAAQVAYFGKRVALVEQADELGGACANTGTLPSKTLRESALFLSGFRQRGIYGVELSARTQHLSVADFMVQKEYVVRRERERVLHNLDRHKIELVHGTARFLDANTVRVERLGAAPRDLHAGVFLIATGSYPFRPPGIPFEDPDIDDSDEVLTLDRIPRSFIVLGGGVIGSEYASIFAALGIVKVTLVEDRPRILGFLDREIGETLVQAFQRMGIEVIINDGVTSYEKPEGGERGVRVTLRSGRVLEADRLLVAGGRTGNTRGLGLEAIGVQVDDRGRIPVDSQYRTSAPHIYAAGDVVGWPSLASTSMDQGRVAMCHAFGFTYKRSLASFFPYGLYTIPEVSMVGQSEEEARKQGHDVETGRAYYRDNARGQIINDPEGMIKLVFEAGNRKLLGAHVLGERATEMIHIAQAVMGYGGSIDYFIDNVFNYPTVSELYKYAAYDGLGRLAKRGV